MEHYENVNNKKSYGGIPEIPVGSHLALFFTDEDELKDIVCPLLEREISQNRRVVYIRNGVDVGWIKSCIENYNPDKHEHFLKAWTATDISLRRNGFTPRTLLELLQSETTKSSNEGLSGLTVMLEVTNVLMQLFLEGRFMDFFIDLQDQLAMTTNRFIFQYNLSKLDKRVLHMIMTEHPCLLHDNELEFNPFYTKKDESPAKRFLSHVKSLNLLKQENESVKSKNQELLSCKQRLEDTVSALKNEMKSHEDELLRIKEENKQKVERIERIQEQLKTDQREIQEYKDKETALQEQLKRKIRSIEDLQKSFDIFKLRHSKFEEEITTRDARNEKLTQQLTSMENLLREKENQIDALEAEMERQKENYEITQQALEEYKAVNADLVRETDSLENQLSELETQRDRLKEENQTLYQKTEEQREGSTQEIEALHAQIASQKARIEELTTNLSHTKEQLQEKEALSQELKAAKEHLQTLLSEKDETLNDKNRQIYRFSSLYDEFKQKASVLNDEKLRIEIKYKENMHKVSSSLKSIKAHHDLDKQKLEDAKIQLETLKETVKKLTTANETLSQEAGAAKKEVQELRISLENVERQNEKLRDILKSTNQNASKIEENNLSLKGKLSKLQEQQEKLLESEKTLTQERDHLKLEMESLQQVSREQVEQLQKKLEKSYNTLHNIQMEKAQLQSEIEKAQHSLEVNQDRIDEFDSENKKLTEIIQKAKENEESLREKLSSSETELERVLVEKKRVNEKLDHVNNSLTKLQERHSRLQQDLEEMRNAVGNRDEMIKQKDTQLEGLKAELNLKNDEIKSLRDSLEDMKVHTANAERQKRRIQEALNQHNQEKEQLKTEVKMLKLMIEEKEGILSKEMNNIIQLKDEIEHLKYDKLLLTREKDALIQKFNLIEKKLSSFGALSSNDNLENYRMMQISKSLSDNKPSE